MFVVNIHHHCHRHHAKIYSAPITWRTSLIVVNSRPNQQTLKAKLRKCVFDRFLKSTETETACMFSGIAFHVAGPV